MPSRSACPASARRGPEVFEHIDGALFDARRHARLDHCGQVEAYIEAAVRMITQHDEREALRQP